MTARASTRRRRARGGRGGAEPRARLQTRAHDAWLLALRGYTQREIAERLGVSQPAICKILQRVVARDEADRAGHAARARALAAGRLGLVIRELWSGWDRSQRDQTRKRQRRLEATATGAPARQLTELTVETRAGDPRFLRELKDICFAEAAARPCPGEVPVAPAIDLRGLTDEQLTRLERAIVDAARARPAGGAR